MDDKHSSNFLDRLKRHYMFRIAAIYAIAGWVIIQLFNIVLPNFGLAKDSIRFVIIILALGFPVMLALAWTFIKPSTEGYEAPSRWTRWRLRIGSVLSFIIIIIVCISGWYLWRLAVISHVAAEVVSTAPPLATQSFNPQPNTIAVLPFINLNNDQKQQYFSDGITEEITSDLGALPGVRVISWQSTSMYRGRKISITEVGRALNVANVLVGSIHRDGDRIRISTELVNTVTGFQLWSDHYDRTFKDIFSIQDNISKAMVSALKLHLSVSRPLVAEATKNINAHDLYLKGLDATNARTPASLNAAIIFFKQAIKIDNRYAAAYAALAWTYCLTTQYTPIPLKISLPQAKMAAKQALRLNKNLSSAHVAMGTVDFLEGHITRGQKELKRAMELNPNNVNAYNVYATSLRRGDLKEAIAYFKKITVLDPNYATAHNNLAHAYEVEGDYKKAITELQATIGLSPQDISTRLSLAGLYNRISDHKSAVDILTGIETGNPLQLQIIDAARLVYMAQQKPSLNNQAIIALQQISMNKISSNEQTELVPLFVLVGQKKHALQILTLVCSNAPEICADIAVNPEFKDLQKEPEFEVLVKKYGTSE